MELILTLAMKFWQWTLTACNWTIINSQTKERNQREFNQDRIGHATKGKGSEEPYVVVNNT